MISIALNFLTMKYVIKFVQIFCLLLLIARSTAAQDYNSYRSSDAMMLQVNDNSRIETRLTRVVIALSNNTNQLSIRLSIPYHAIDNKPAEDEILSSPVLTGNLELNINPGKIQDYLTSAKLFTTQALFTLNNITKAVTVEYVPLPVGPDQEGDFNLSIIIQFNGADFNMDSPNSNSQFIIKLNNAAVNRI